VPRLTWRKPLTHVMSSLAVTVAPGAYVQNAARTMSERKIGCFLVVEEERIVVILTESDIYRHVAGR